jgi:hypothetical protein
MVGSFSSYVRGPAPGSLLHRWLAAHRQHPDSFDCGVRVIAGSVAGEGRRWRYRRSALDPLMTDGVRALNHGTKVRLYLMLAAGPFVVGAHATRPGHVLLSAAEVGSSAQLQLSVPVGELERFGLDPG